MKETGYVKGKMVEAMLECARRKELADPMRIDLLDKAIGLCQDIFHEDIPALLPLAVECRNELSRSLNARHIRLVVRTLAR